MFKLIYNVFQTIGFSMFSISLSIVYGKMPKISAYHFNTSSQDNGVFDITNDKYIKTNSPDNVSGNCKRIIINEFINHLYSTNEFSNVIEDVEFPVFDGKEVVGNINFFTVVKNINALRQY